MEKATPFASARIVRALEKAFGQKATTFTVSMPRNRDVANFLRKMDEAHRRTAGSQTRFGPAVSEPR